MHLPFEIQLLRLAFWIPFRISLLFYSLQCIYSRSSWQTLPGYDSPNLVGAIALEVDTQQRKFYDLKSAYVILPAALMSQAVSSEVPY